MRYGTDTIQETEISGIEESEEFEPEEGFNSEDEIEDDGEYPEDL